MNGPDWDLNPGLVHHYFSHSITFVDVQPIATYWIDRLNPVREDPGVTFEGKNHLKGGLDRLVEYRRQIAQWVQHLTRDTGGPGPSLFLPSSYNIN